MKRFAIATGKSMKTGLFGNWLIYDKTDYMVGDIVCFKGNYKKRYCYRIILIEEINDKLFFTMKGDRLPKSENYEIRVPEENIEGKIIWSFPKLK